MNICIRYKIFFLIISFSISVINAQPIFKFAVIGDYGKDNKAEADVAAQVNNWGVDFIVTVGDNYYGAADGSYADSWQALDDAVGKHYHNWIKPYSGSYGSGSSDINRFFPALGNHEWYHLDSSDIYLDFFYLTPYSGTSGNERYYDFVWENVHFFILSPYGNGLTEYTFPRHGNYGEPDGVVQNSLQAQWLQTQLENADSSHWKVVITHHPPFSSSNEHGSEPAVQWPFKDWGADMILSGHDHTYERLIVNDLVYFVNGLGGGDIYNFGNPVTGSQFRYNADYGAMLFEVYNDSIICKFINRSGSVIDSYELLFSGIPVGLTEFNTSISDYKLFQNYPNPFNSSTKISFQIPKASKVKISVYNSLGDEIIELLDQYKQAGFYEISFDSLDLPAGRQSLRTGIYFYKISTPEYTAAKKMILLK